MKKISLILFALLTICFIFSCSDQQPTEFHSEDESIQVVIKNGGGNKPVGVKYSSSVSLSAYEFTVSPDYYDNNSVG